MELKFQFENNGLDCNNHIFLYESIPPEMNYEAVYSMFMIDSYRILYGTKSQSNYRNLIDPFPGTLWALVLSTLLTFIVVFLLVYRVYSKVN